MDGPGRPTRYRPEFAEQAYELCLAGATNQDLADHFEVTRSTIDKWRRTQPAFAQSLKRGRLLADVHCPPDVQTCLFWLRNRRTLNGLVPPVQAVPARSILHALCR